MRLALLLALALAVPVHASTAPRRVLLTGFEPFGGREKNMSYEIAKALARDPSLIADGVEVSLCRLPVDYDRAAKVAETCFESSAPYELVVSLGEGDCTIRLETAATNLDDTPMPDNSGVLREGQVIDPTLPARIGLTLAVDRMYCTRVPSRAPIRPSVSPGFYVCNNTAFHLAHYFRARTIPYGFVHVPPSDCGRRASRTSQNARVIGKLLAAVLASGEAPVGYPLPHPALPANAWATDQESNAALLERARAAEAPGCSLDFLELLGERYQGPLSKIRYFP